VSSVGLDGGLRPTGSELDVGETQRHLTVASELGIFAQEPPQRGDRGFVITGGEIDQTLLVQELGGIHSVVIGLGQEPESGPSPLVVAQEPLAAGKLETRRRDQIALRKPLQEPSKRGARIGISPELEQTATHEQQRVVGVGGVRVPVEHDGALFDRTLERAPRRRGQRVAGGDPQTNAFVVGLLRVIEGVEIGAARDRA
jgi:hypothetical protein